jgi:hypothetical protein
VCVCVEQKTDIPVYKHPLHRDVILCVSFYLSTSAEMVSSNTLQLTHVDLPNVLCNTMVRGFVCVLGTGRISTS